jgi:hypothetical protein
MRGKTPTESQEQIALFQYAAIKAQSDPRWNLLLHIPNGGKRNIVTAVRMKREGVKKGVPDLFLPVANHYRHGLFIEMKRPGCKPTPQQKSWMTELAIQGYECVVCYSASEAISEIGEYLK